MDKKLSYNINNQKEIVKIKSKRKPIIIWFNPQYSRSVKVNIWRIFIKLISKHFPPNHKVMKIFNRNTLTHISPVSHICDMNVYALFKPYFSVKLAGFCFLIAKHTLNILFT